MTGCGAKLRVAWSPRRRALERGRALTLVEPDFTVPSLWTHQLPKCVTLAPLFPFFRDSASRGNACFLRVAAGLFATFLSHGENGRPWKLTEIRGISRYSRKLTRGPIQRLRYRISDWNIERKLGMPREDSNLDRRYQNPSCDVGAQRPLLETLLHPCERPTSGAKLTATLSRLMQNCDADQRQK